MARDVPSVGSGKGDTIFPNFVAVKELWNVWEIHCLILVSLFLQVVLFLFAGMRSRSSSGILRIILWLAYLSADSVAIFVLGHLVIHAEGPRHHLMYFWAPFVLVHLGGQDTITAFSKQDNELWRRHLLNFVTQVAMVGYVVATASWPDRRLKAAMVLMFLSGCFKSLSDLKVPKGEDGNIEELRKHAKNYMTSILTLMLQGAISLEVCSLFSNLRYLPDGMIRSAVCCVASCIQPAGSTKQWSEELAQYNMIKTRALKSGRLFKRKFCKRLAAKLSDTTHIPITECHTPIQKFVIDNLLCLGERKEWDITGSRGKLALQRWTDSHEDPDSARTGKTLQKSMDLDFSTSVLIWNIATEMCYHYGQNNSNSDSDEIKEDKQVSRELSNYIAYLVFKCKVLLTTSSRLLHNRANDEISEWLSKLRQDNLGEEDFVQKLFESKKEEQQDTTDEIQKPQEQENQPDDSMLTKIQKLKELDDAQDSTVIEIMKTEEEQQDSMATEIQKPEDLGEAQGSRAIEIQKHKKLVEEQQDSMVTEVKKPAEQADDSNMQKLVKNTLEALDSPVLPRARGVAQELIGIKDAAERWRLIAAVWLEMLYYVAPRCGGAFHYEHLSTGGEFVTHVLLLLQFLGPFLPPPSA
ncbi:hypothetical protein QOZ80_3AG0227520 [Eleusine coracana subsp. coracana]|nr:hypothetical protein QOZ80_3AG0227520 [Eleusine coracana subsp. coracana]